ncbi:ABC transporter ATP-binding protein [Mycobacterium sp. GA-2829]|uniref:ABC transporter ATP-binding protein n=1 Tax=Mycobacterium sp. GA-2829 TaxID=1772283 RepID=UPI000B306F50|nr:ATP-binding cassette domain-containing protein [Mycobacterium sp. GA-2829]
MLEVRALRTGYSSAEVVRGADFSVRQGGVVAIIGKNGMGKSTLLKAMVNIVKPWSGEVLVAGTSLRPLKPFRVARQGVTYIPQEKAIFGDLSVEENIRLGLPKNADIDAAMSEVVTLFPKLRGRTNQKAGTLSGGEQKMLLLARALVSRPALLIIDEITEGLQPSVRNILRTALAHEQETRGTTIVLVEQDLEFAFGVADSYAVMKLGQLSALRPTAGADWRTVAEAHLAV